MQKLRLRWPATQVPHWTLSHLEFINEFSELTPQRWAALPAGPVVVESLDAQDRVAWTGHYKNSRELGRLLRQLLEEREIAARVTVSGRRR